MTVTSSLPRRAWRWAAFFVVLGVLAALAVTLPIFYNLGQQLRPEQLEAARRRWRENGPADYDLILDLVLNRERLAERHRVLVRGGKVVFASFEMKPVERDVLGRASVRGGQPRRAAGEGELTALAPALAAAVGLPAGGVAHGRAWDVPAIFDHIEALLDEEEASSRRNFLVASFDRVRGYPVRLTRRVRGSSEREEWTIYIWPAGTLQRKSEP
jgi:hypothetical protein